eukprot:364500-Chlamydomonas_euryale.AAC.6
MVRQRRRRADGPADVHREAVAIEPAQRGQPRRGRVERDAAVVAAQQQLVPGRVELGVDQVAARHHALKHDARLGRVK